MSFKREIWTDWNIRKPCPNCNVGTLNIVESKSMVSETPESIYMNSLDAYYTNEFIFSIHLKCNNRNCEHVVAVSGDKYVYEERNEDTNEIETKFSFNPKSFYPAPNIIAIPKDCSELFTKTLKESFSLYWLDLSSCANKIRVSIEVLMSDFGIPNLNNTLHKRIELFEKQNSEAGEFLKTIKLVGNAGSHYSNIEINDVLDAYELLEYSLEKIFKEKEKKISKLNSDVSKRMKVKKN